MLNFYVIWSSRDSKSFKLQPVRNVGRSYDALLAQFYFQFQLLCNLRSGPYQTKRENFKDSSVAEISHRVIVSTYKLLV